MSRDIYDYPMMDQMCREILEKTKDKNFDPDFVESVYSQYYERDLTYSQEQAIRNIYDGWVRPS